MGIDPPPQPYSVAPSPDGLDRSNGLRVWRAITLFDFVRYNIFFSMNLKMALYHVNLYNLIASKANNRTVMHNQILYDMTFKNMLILLQLVLDYKPNAVSLVPKSNSVFKTLCAQIITQC